METLPIVAIGNKIKSLEESKFSTVIFAQTGSVATIKANEIIMKLLLDLQYNVIYLQTKSACHFTQNCDKEWTINSKQIDKTLIERFGIEKKPIFAQFSDEDEYACWKKRGDIVLHIKIRELADMMVIAPLSANTMAKLCNGICDNLITNVFRCWPYKKENSKWVI